MKLYAEDKQYKLFNGDMKDMLEVIKPNSIDAIVCDPPYELNFMSKGWDNSGIAFNKDAWRKCYEVLKPGGYLLAFGGTRTYHRIACAIEDAGFEIRDCLIYLYGCYSKDTQVLTDKGWKYFFDLDKTEKILQWNKETNELNWIKPLNYFEYDIDDELIHFKNRHTDQLITKNHNVVCKIKKRCKQKSEYKFCKASDIQKSDVVDFPLAGQLKQGVHNDYAYIIGWWLTDAWKHKDGKACMFTQSKLETLNKLRNYFDVNNIKYSEYIKKSKKVNHNPEHVFYVTGEIATYLLSNYNDRKITYDFLTWDYESRQKLLEGLIDGDGSRRKDGYGLVFYSKKADRLDICQALCLSLNMRSHIDYKKGCIFFNPKHNSTQTQFKHYQPPQVYAGKVYCLQTETGAFVVRRNGKAFISGNSGFPKSMNVGLAIDKKMGCSDRGHRVATASRFHPDGTFEPNGESLPPYEGRTAEGKKWTSYGTALKPAYEPIIMARKPIEGTVAENVLKYGVGGINIDECRVGDEEISTHNAPKGTFAGGEPNRGSDTNSYSNHQGRFPANVITDGSDEVKANMPHTKSSGGNLTTYNFKDSKEGRLSFGQNSKTLERLETDYIAPTDNGYACRYFYCAKASKKDRDEGLEQFDQIKVNDGRKKEIDNAFQRGSTPRRNNHPTVKPIELMQYLIRLVLPQGGVLLDCFMGSGSTGKACMFENRERNANYYFIGIELTDEYLPICKARIDYAINKYEYDLKQKEAKTGQMNLFDFGE